MSLTPPPSVPGSQAATTVRVQSASTSPAEKANAVNTPERLLIEPLVLPHGKHLPQQWCIATAVAHVLHFSGRSFPGDPEVSESRRNDQKKASAPSARSKPAAGRVTHDSRGNAVWNWAIDTD